MSNEKQACFTRVSEIGGGGGGYPIGVLVFRESDYLGEYPYLGGALLGSS